MSDAQADRAIVARALDGDARARRALASRLLDAVHQEVAACLSRRAAARSRDPRQDVADLVQEVLVSLFDRDAQELRRWDPERGRSLESFVRLVARRRVARILGQRRGNPWAGLPKDPTDIELPDDAAAVRRLENRAELDAVLERLHAEMSVRDHALFELVFVRQLSPDDVAQQMDMSRGAVNAWSYRMRKLARAITASSSPASSTKEDKETSSHG